MAERTGTRAGLCVPDVLNVVSACVHVASPGTAGSRSQAAMLQSQGQSGLLQDDAGHLGEKEPDVAWST